MKALFPILQRITMACDCTRYFQLKLKILFNRFRFRVGLRHVTRKWLELAQDGTWFFDWCYLVTNVFLMCDHWCDRRFETHLMPQVSTSYIAITNRNFLLQ